ncbi:MAG: pyridoxamine 5'-phosphate oxidase family protein [Eggerthellaceae bacterium]|nr:pyridoxamine 5'-phosphate oxidase family protein [Eggerthellaceae bacterium]
MADKQKMSDFLGECGVFYFATTDGDAPVVRPIGFQMCKDGELYFGIGTHKAVFAQIKANPKVSIAGTKPDGTSWIRINAEVAFDDDPALVDAAFEVMPQLKPLYESNGWTMGMFHLASGNVTYYENLMAPTATEEF